MNLRHRDPVDRRRNRTLHSSEASASRADDLPSVSGRSHASGALALGALAIGALAIGALAIGALAIGRMGIGRARIRRLEIDELVVRQLRVTKDPQDAPPPDRDA
jgi:hypothetical protein